MKLFSSRVPATLLAALSVASCAKQEPPAAAPYAVYEVPLSQVAADLAAGKTTSVAVAQGYIERIKKYDDTLHSVILVSPMVRSRLAVTPFSQWAAWICLKGRFIPGSCF